MEGEGRKRKESCCCQTMLLACLGLRISGEEDRWSDEISNEGYESSIEEKGRQSRTCNHQRRDEMWNGGQQNFVSEARAESRTCNHRRKDEMWNDRHVEDGFEARLSKAKPSEDIHTYYQQQQPYTEETKCEAASEEQERVIEMDPWEMDEGWDMYRMAGMRDWSEARKRGEIREVEIKVVTSTTKMEMKKCVATNEMVGMLVFQAASLACKRVKSLFNHLHTPPSLFIHHHFSML